MKISDILILRNRKEINFLIDYYFLYELPAFIKLEIDFDCEYTLVQPMDTVLMVANDPYPLVEYFGSEKVMFEQILQPLTLVKQLSSKRDEFKQALLTANPGNAVIAIEYWKNSKTCMLQDPILLESPQNWRCC
ncbi:hypothetical protein [Mastigocoleus sp. MO_188.B34]|uniref:hypothetical protein n=1 Tax=Mastigocoleus sp. MO_188.B34 TaxID=3036635 RepID=UPI0026081C8F|nr:hypothetical protein [Mastigocoleus sp. MO_188.B34]MDJ0692892.1 hypothetical protein [Mastigocoleus sp. MO_188.B34]